MLDLLFDQKVIHHGQILQAGGAHITSSLIKKMKKKMGILSKISDLLRSIGGHGLAADDTGGRPGVGHHV